MKLARKLTLAILSVMIAVFSVHALERIDRDGRVLREDIRRDHRTLGRALRAIVPDVWREDGPKRALALIEATNQQENAIFLRWVWPYGAGDSGPAVPLPDAHLLFQSKHAEVVAELDGVDWLYTYVPVRLYDGRVGAVELRESLAFESEQMRATIWRTVLSTLLIASLAGLLTSWLGVSFVGRPIALIMEKARRVGEGDLSGPLEIQQRDELGDLAREMNAMCERLETESSARKLALEQLRHAERLTTVGRLAAGLAHELGTPLNVVSIEAKRIVVGKAQGADAVEAARGIDAQIKRMTQIISQLLDFARRRSPRLMQLSLDEVAQSAVAMLGTLAHRSRVQLEYAPGTHASVSADPGQLQQVLTNLVVNAIHASSPGQSVKLEVGTDLHARAGAGSTLQSWAFMRVKDEGTGMSREVQARIFEPFFTTKEVGQGTGLGLSVAHGIMEEHHGLIEVESSPGQGSVFTVRMPAVEVAASARGPEREAREPNERDGEARGTLTEQDPEVT
jgi:two-component system NtrC family sensor kinase